MPRRGGRTNEQWVEQARNALVDFLDQEHAAVWEEVEAKLADSHWEGLPDNIKHIDPHHLTTAKIQLLELGVIAETQALTRGGRRPISVFHLADLHRRQTTFRAVAARKRLLQARYYSWAFGNKGSPGLLGPSGEAVLRSSLRAASPDAGYRLIRPDGGEVRQLFGEPVPGGPLDSGAYLPEVDQDGMPGPTLTVPIEVKNRRGWIYPNSHQLYQLLYKAAALQARYPEAGLVPLLVCRRHHITAQWMAAELGFFILAAKSQFIAYPDDADIGKLDEVRMELGYIDMTADVGPSAELVGYLARGLPKVATRTAERWKQFGPPLVEHFKALRRDTPQPGRTADMAAMRDTVRDLGGTARW